MDVLDYDQTIAIYNKLNYQPQPVFQNYSTYTPALTQLNANFYHSDHAPNFVLLKMISIDEHLPIMNDSTAFYLITHHYKYVHTEKSFQLWQKTGEPLTANTTPHQLETRDLPLDQT
jgi:hypothetical protein